MDNSKKITTIKDIARELGLSAMAVSKALNDQNGVSLETREKVFEVAKRLNYKPNVIAKSLKLKNTKTIGIVVSDSSQFFLAKVIKGIEDEAVKEGYSIILSNTDSNVEKEKKAINVLVSKRIDGIILVSSMLTGVEHVDFLNEIGVPYLFLVRRSENTDVDYVANDNILGSFQMTGYLLKENESKIHFLNLTENSPSARDRLEGYKKAMEDKGVSYDPALIQYIKPEVEEGYIAMRRLLEKDEKVRTVFCGCDVIAIGAMEAIFEKGLKVPEDIRVAGYDDIEFAAYLRVPLTTVSQPKYMIGSKGVEVLLNKIKNKTNEVQHIVLRPNLVIRNST